MGSQYIEIDPNDKIVCVNISCTYDKGERADNYDRARHYWNIKFEDKRKTFTKIKGTYLEQIPIPSTSNKDVADCALAINNAIESGDDATELLDRLDYLVYKLYGLSFDEIQVIDPETSLTREKYEGGK